MRSQNNTTRNNKLPHMKALRKTKMQSKEVKVVLLGDSGIE